VQKNKTIAKQKNRGNHSSTANYAKISINKPNDQYEQEADAVAEKIVQMPAFPPNKIKPSTSMIAQSIQRKCIACEEEEKNKTGMVMRKEAEMGNLHVPPSFNHFLQASKGTGSSLPPATRSFMENAFSTDFSKVQVHTDTLSADMNKSIYARAFTIGSDIYFNHGQYLPGTETGKKLIAHELTHVVQQGEALSLSNHSNIKKNRASALNNSKSISRKESTSSKNEKKEVAYISVYVGKGQYIDFHTTSGIFRYNLSSPPEISPGEYEAEVIVKGNEIKFIFNIEGGKLFNFTYSLDTDQPNPSTLFSKQKIVLFNVTETDSPSLKKNKEKEIEEPGATYLTEEEAIERCESGDLKGVKVFPYRGTRFGGAPLTVHRDGEDIIVKSYDYVRTNKDFQSQTKTLPIETFIGGVRLKPNEIVRVHTYEPKWYHLNFTGSTSGDIEDEYCKTGEQMLEIGRRSDNAALGNIALTVFDGATLFLPVGRIASFIGKPIAKAAARGAQKLAIGVLLGLRDAAPSAFAGIASRTSGMLIEEQVVSKIGSKAISQTASQIIINFGENTAVQTAAKATSLATSAAVQKGTGVLSSAVSKTITVTIIDPLGHKFISILTTPSTNNTINNLVNQAYAKPISTTIEQSAQQGVVTESPEIQAGFTQAHVKGLKRLLGKRFTKDDIKILGKLWDDAAGKGPILTRSNSRYLFNLQRNRFWTRVRANLDARKLFEDAGCQFTDGAPFYNLNGKKIIITIDHIIERQTRPDLALTASNLQLSFFRENTVFLRLLNQLSPFK
jgi:Domain of unknown function (DUF4157)